MDEHYGITDLTHYMNGRPMFSTAVPPPPPQPQAHDLHYDMAMLGGGGGGMLFRSDSTTGTTAASTTSGAAGGGGGGGGGLDMEIGGGGLENEIGGGGGGGVGGNCRWPRQETLTLLEVRSSLDSKFKEANHKGPLWDEVSRIMAEEHGYQRSGKKCREKFENLYKYYKKTKEGKAGRQDGKHYRFFRQLEAIYGETSTSVNPNSTPIPTAFSDHHHPHAGIETCGFQLQAHQQSNNTYQKLFKPAPSRPCHSPSLSNSSSAFDTCSSGYSDPNGVDNMPTSKRRMGKRGWKTKIKEFVDAQMRKVVEKQEEWMEKMMRSIEQKEEERVLREEQWRKEETARFEKEHKFWANERAWMESRDSALMEALQKLNGKESLSSRYKSSFDDQHLHINHHNNGKIDTTINLTPWGENELTRLIQLRTSMETRFEHGSGHMEDLLWEEIGSKMACLGYNRNGVTCKNKWDSVNEFLLRTKKRKENTRSIDSSYTHLNNNNNNNEPVPSIFHHPDGNYRQADQRIVAPNDEQNDGSSRFVMVDQESMWDGYGMKLRMGEDQ
ncbi:hypothetical protein SSX86_003342 [Deinandra increscens subsp. villosa]|uniref:Myb-like domain-containing protein n=1 Tax=Deinandra increscens subsp. villosa TaxID=3103831 RepID=A0AAP0DPZ8_9ASTR